MMMMMNIHLTLFEVTFVQSIVTSLGKFECRRDSRKLMRSCFNFARPVFNSHGQTVFVLNCPFRFYSKQSTLLLKEVVRHLKWLSSRIHLLTADISWSFVVYVAHVNLLITLSFYNHKTDTCNFLKRRERKLVKNYFILQYLKTFLCFHKLRVWTMEMTSR